MPSMSKGIKQFTHFSFIGIGNGILDLAALNLLLWVWPSPGSIGLLTINSIAYALAVINSYIWNSRLTFREEARFSKNEKLLFFLQAAVSLVISNAVFLFFSWSLPYLIHTQWIMHNTAKLLSMALSSLASFFFMKVLVFRARSQPHE
jgi:putative flippase GtrA